jgi:hypothetical protein
MVAGAIEMAFARSWVGSFFYFLQSESPNRRNLQCVRVKQSRYSAFPVRCVWKLNCACALGFPATLLLLSKGPRHAASLPIFNDHSHLSIRENPWPRILLVAPNLWN